MTPKQKRVPPASKQTSDHYGLTAVILGILALIGSLFPLIAYDIIGWVAGAAVIFGIAGFTSQGIKKTMALTGLVTGALAATVVIDKIFDY
ncbi:hypothetical protein G3T36_15160 [Diaminobutyricibacter tongyongensis]|uniref:DUF4190 domain-containing protein n=1 Tax=Leifsonia tongyongensis TaxID=1268043 RepID=A0A6L9Y0N2_9MICO|nr:hypothetical protein [Diaminobutyricibacter tongyongensis]NEN07200.1 hypothetical protein [Diaminobutyricibacter tongyongensis]